MLLIDEIDKADPEFEAFLLEVLSRLPGHACPSSAPSRPRHIPLVVLTSNNAREMSDALKRRCLHLYIDFPDARAGARDRAPEGARSVASAWRARWWRSCRRMRKLDLKKAPSISETLDWARALTLLNVETLDEELVQRNADDDPQVRRRHPQGAGRASRLRREAEGAAEAPAGAGQRRSALSSAMDAEAPRVRALLRENGVRVSSPQRISIRSQRSGWSASATAAHEGRAARDDGQARASTSPCSTSSSISTSPVSATRSRRATQTRAGGGRYRPEPQFEELLEKLEQLLAEQRIKTSRRWRARGCATTRRGSSSASGRRSRGQQRQGSSPTPGRAADATRSPRRSALGGLPTRSRRSATARRRGARSARRSSRSQRYLDQRLRDLARLIKQAARQEVEKRDVAARASSSALQPLAREELLLPHRGRHAAHARGGRAARAAPEERRSRSGESARRRGRFDLKRTLRENLQYGGIPFDVHFDRNVAKKSHRSSCCATSRIRCATCHASCCSSSTRCRTSTRRCGASSSSRESGEITRLFEDNDIQEAIDLSLRGDIINVFAHSDFGRAFKMFHRDFSPR